MHTKFSRKNQYGYVMIILNMDLKGIDFEDVELIWLKIMY
jgi:hypothetical protein